MKSEMNGVDPSAARIIERVMAYVEERLTDGISLRDVAQAIGYSPCHLTTTFRRATGLPVTAWIIRRRIDAAKQLLREPGDSVARVSETLGYVDLCHFRRQFVRHVGMTPTDYRSHAQ